MTPIEQIFADKIMFNHNYLCHQRSIILAFRDTHNCT